MAIDIGRPQSSLCYRSDVRTAHTVLLRGGVVQHVSLIRCGTLWHTQGVTRRECVLSRVLAGDCHRGRLPLALLLFMCGRGLNP